MRGKLAVTILCGARGGRCREMVGRLWWTPEPEPLRLNTSQIVQHRLPRNLRCGPILMSCASCDGADGDLTRLLDEDAIVYSGYSAGPCVLAPTLRGLEAVDGASVVEEVYGDQPIWEGLGVLDYSIVPHVASPEHPESAALGLVAEQYRRFGIPHKTLRDGEVLIIDGTTEFVCR